MDEGQAASKWSAAPERRRDNSDRSLRDVVALSTLPAIWTGAEPLRIAESLAASLFTMLDSEFIYVSFVLSSSPPVAIAQTGRYETDSALAEKIGPAVLDWSRAHDPDDLLPLDLRGPSGAVRLATRQIGLNAELGVIAAAFAPDRDLSQSPLLLLNVAATQAAVAVQNANLVQSLQASELRTSRAAEELRIANTDLEQFAYSASHDLQEPLRTVKVFTQMLAERAGEKLDAESLEYLDYVISGATRMEVLIRDLLLYAQTTRSETSDEPTDASGAVRTALTNLQGAIEQTGATIEFEPLPLLRIHPSQLVLLFQNLIGNAIKYGESGVKPAVRIAAAKQNTHWLISVSDNGIGIGAQYRERIFGLFKRLHTGDRYSGTGIGLALCRRIVERHQGRIWVESESGKGSTFYFTLPA